MNPFEEFVERLFAQAQRFQDRLSEDWREHANRRTIIIVILLGALSAATYLLVIQPPDNFPTGELVTVPAGESVDEIAQTLQDDGVIRNPLAFKLIVAALGRQRGVYAGDYIFKEPETVLSIARALSIGAYGLEPFKIRIPEGATMKQMAILYSAVLQRFSAENFLAQTSSQEGYLFPDTYFFLPNATETTVIQAMRQNFESQIGAIEPTIASSTHSLSDIVAMASIVEKEASNTQDRRMIAGVLWHRIALGIPLQSDVTVIYATGKADSDLTLADLESQSPYNSYTHKGLPPTPIDSPSINSLEAAADPIASPYLFYLADKHGVTHYAKTYAQQLRNERLYLGS
jgi:UPF0755 protein